MGVSVFALKLEESATSRMSRGAGGRIKKLLTPVRLLLTPPGDGLQKKQ